MGDRALGRDEQTIDIDCKGEGEGCLVTLHWSGAPSVHIETAADAHVVEKDDWIAAVIVPPRSTSIVVWADREAHEGARHSPSPGANEASTFYDLEYRVEPIVCGEEGVSNDGVFDMDEVDEARLAPSLAHPYETAEYVLVLTDGYLPNDMTVRGRLEMDADTPYYIRLEAGCPRSRDDGYLDCRAEGAVELLFASSMKQLSGKSDFGRACYFDARGPGEIEATVDCRNVDYDFQRDDSARLLVSFMRLAAGEGDCTPELTLER